MYSIANNQNYGKNNELKNETVREVINLQKSPPGSSGRGYGY
jgi:hypothetical protein